MWMCLLAPLSAPARAKKFRFISQGFDLHKGLLSDRNSPLCILETSVGEKSLVHVKTLANKAKPFGAGGRRKWDQKWPGRGLLLGPARDHLLAPPPGGSDLGQKCTPKGPPSRAYSGPTFGARPRQKVSLY